MFFFLSSVIYLQYIYGASMKFDADIEDYTCMYIHTIYSLTHTHTHTHTRARARARVLILLEIFNQYLIISI